MIAKKSTLKTVTTFDKIFIIFVVPLFTSDSWN